MTIFMRAVSSVLGMLLVGTALAEEANTSISQYDIDRVPNVQGLTGLLVTNSAYTLRAGEVRLNASVISENYEDNTVIPAIKTTIMSTPVSLTVGLTGNWEVAALGRAYALKVDTGSSATDVEEAGAGAVEFLTKIRIHSQSDFLPAMALGIGYISSSGDNDTSFDFRSAEQWGARGMAMISTEMPVTENSFIGLYAEVQAVTIDPSEDEYDIATGEGSRLKNDYTVINAGVRIPISDNNRLHLLLEYSGSNGLDIGWLGSTFSGTTSLDYDDYTASIRYAWKYMSFGVGMQSHGYKESSLGDYDTTRYIANFGLGF